MKYPRLFSASLAQANITPRTVGFLVILFEVGFPVKSSNLAIYNWWISSRYTSPTT